MSDAGSGNVASGEFESRIAALEAKLDDLTANVSMAADVDVIWVVISAVLVFFMQVGFAMLEVGSVSSKNTKAVLLKNIGDASLGALSWWLVGFAFAFGDSANGFIGTDMLALAGGNDFGTVGMKEAQWVFNWAFAATSVTIVSGAIAERVKIVSYVVYAVVLTSFIYPVVVHWAWHVGGWASPYRIGGEGRPLLAGCGAADFAGSGVVHMVGGLAALVATVAVKPRKGRFNSRNGKPCRLAQQSPALQTLGTLILWVGWYAFNAGSTVTISGGRSVVAARAVVSTTIGPSAGVLVMVILLKLVEKKFDSRGVNNGILSGLVAVTAGAPLINPEGAFVTGVVAAVVYYTSADLLLRCKVDDVVDAAPVHLFCGIWGLIATGLFTTREGWALTYGEERADECCGLLYGCGFNLLFANLALMCSIAAWVGLTSVILFSTITATIGLRVSRTEEARGMDLTRHSFSATGSFSAAGGGIDGGTGGGRNGGMNAVQRAIATADGNGGPDNSHGASRGGGGGGGDGLRSVHSSRAASLSCSKHCDLSAAAAGGVVGNNINGSRHDQAWGWSHGPAPLATASAAAAGARGGNTGSGFSQPQATQQRSSSLRTLKPAPAEALPPSAGRQHSGYGFIGGKAGNGNGNGNGVAVAGGDGGGGGGNGRLLGFPAGEKPATPDLRHPRSRTTGGHEHRHQFQQGWDGGGGVETKIEGL